MIQWLRLQALNAGRPGSIPGQGTRSHMPQLRDRMSQLKTPYATRVAILCTTTKTQHSQINISKVFKKKVNYRLQCPLPPNSLCLLKIKDPPMYFLYYVFSALLFRKCNMGPIPLSGDMVRIHFSPVIPVIASTAMARQTVQSRLTPCNDWSRLFSFLQCRKAPWFSCTIWTFSGQWDVGSLDEGLIIFTVFTITPVGCQL